LPEAEGSNPSGAHNVAAAERESIMRYDDKLSNIEYIRRLRKLAASYAKAGYYTQSQYYRDRADTIETTERARLAMLVKEIES